MRIKQTTENGNVAPYENRESLHRDSNSQWNHTSEVNTNNLYKNRTSNLRLNSNFNTIYKARESSETFVDYNKTKEIRNHGDDNPNGGLEVCNKQYRIDSRNNVNLARTRNNTETLNLEGATETVIASCESFPGA